MELGKGYLKLVKHNILEVGKREPKTLVFEKVHIHVNKGRIHVEILGVKYPILEGSGNKLK